MGNAAKWLIMDDGQIVDLARAGVKHGDAIESFSDAMKTVVKHPCRVLVERTFRWQKDTHPYRIPDIAILCDNFGSSNGIDFDGVPWFIMEVLSQSTEHIDRNEKMALYAAVGVQEYWIFDPESKSLEQYVNMDGKMNLRGTLLLHDGMSLSFLTKDITFELNNEGLT